ncbi:MAG: hypothetical protein NW207_10205 [Cytophagales bacterium]|nr:hypothetical protein [Cytophagales bacterium]
MGVKKILNQDVTKIKYFNLIFVILFLVYILVFSVLTAQYTYARYYDLENLGFGYGQLIKNILRSGLYKSCHSHYVGVCLSAHRLPFIPYFLVLLKNVLGSNDCYIIIIVKNLIFMPLTGLAILLTLHKTKALLWHSLLVLVPLFTPPFVIHTFNIAYEEGYVVPVLACVFALLLYIDKDSPKGIYIALFILNSLLFFLKHTFLYVCPFVIGLFFIKTKDKIFTFVGAAFLVASMFYLASFNYYWADRFTLRASWEGLNIFKGNHILTDSIYPKYTLDMMETMPELQPPRTLHTEWEVNEYYASKGYDFIKNNPIKALKFVCIKAFVFFIDIRPNGLLYGQEYMKNRYKLPGMVMMAINRLLFLLIIIFIIGAWRQKAGVKLLANMLVYSIILLSYAFSYMVGFAYERHVMPTLLLNVLFMMYLYKPISV